MYLKIKLMAKNSSDLCNLYSKVIFFRIYVSENIFYFSLLNLNCFCSQQYRESFRKIEQAKLVENLPPSYLPYRFLQNLHSWEKGKIFDFLKTNDQNKTFCAYVVKTNGFALSHDKSLQIYFFFVKRQAKNDFPKDVESTVST